MANSNLLRFRNISKFLCFTILFVLIGSSGYSQQRGIGITGKGILPVQSLSDAVDIGFGLGIVTQNNVSDNVALIGEFSWHRMGGKTTTVAGQEIQGEAINFFDAQLGFRLYLSEMIFVGFYGGYFSGGDIENEFGILPAAGLRLGNVDISANYKLLNDIRYISLRVGWYPFNW